MFILWVLQCTKDALICEGIENLGGVKASQCVAMP